MGNKVQSSLDVRPQTPILFLRIRAELRIIPQLLMSTPLKLIPMPPLPLTQLWFLYSTNSLSLLSSLDTSLYYFYLIFLLLFLLKKKHVNKLLILL